MRKNNKGLTLIELVVTVAIIAIFSGVVLSLITSSSNSFRSTSSTAKVQMETQEVLDTIQDMAIDANRSVYYSYGAADGDFGTEIKNDIDGFDSMGDAASVRSFYVCNAKETQDVPKQELHKYDVITWDPTAQTLNYSHKEAEAKETQSSAPAREKTADEENAVFSSKAKTASGVTAGTNGSDWETIPGTEKSEQSILVENVTSFRADVTKVETQSIVRFQITVNQKGKEITTLHSVNLRNKITVAPPDSAFQNATSSKVYIYIKDSPISWPAGKDCQLHVVAWGGNLQPGYHWSVEDIGAASTGATIDESDGILKASNSGKVKVTVTAYDVNGKEYSDSVEIEITEEDKLKSLEISGIDVVAVNEKGGGLDLPANFEVQAEVGDKPKDVYKGEVTWYCSGSSYASVNGGQLVIDAGAWAVSGAPGTFELWAASKEEPNVKSDHLTVQIARLKIVEPQDGASFSVNEEFYWEVEYYVGDSQSKGYHWECPEGIVQTDTGFKANKSGNYSLEVMAAAGNIKAVELTDSVNIQIKEAYTIQGADYMTQEAADGRKYMLADPYPFMEYLEDEDLALMYWVEDGEGKSVTIPGNAWSTSLEGDILHMQVQLENGELLRKDVHIVSVDIIKPSADTILKTGEDYDCLAKLNPENMLQSEGYKWAATGGTVADGKSVKADKNAEQLTLKVTAKVVIKNKLTKKGGIFEISDEKTYEVNNSKWNVTIKTPSAGGEFFIPANTSDTVVTNIEAFVTNPGGNPGNGNENFTQTATNYVWTLEIPEAKIKFSNHSPYSRFPEGNGKEGYKGKAIIHGWTFADGIESLDGILTVSCVAKNGKRLQATQYVKCVKPKSTTEENYSIVFRGESPKLNVSNGSMLTITYALLKGKYENYTQGTFTYQLKWKDNGESVEGLVIYPGNTVCGIYIDKKNPDKIKEQIESGTERKVNLQMLWTSSDGKYTALSDELELTFTRNKNEW